MIVIKNLFKSYMFDKSKVDILKNINIELFQGLTYIVGKSGSGKTTFLNLISGIDEISSGDVFYDDVKVSNFSEEEWALFRYKNIGFVFQNFNLIEQLNVLENVAFSLQLAGIKEKERKKRALELLNKVGMEKFYSYKPSELSGGQKQRVAIARALINNPKVVFADEPTGALDSKNADNIMELLKEISHKLKITVVVITHSKAYLNKADYIINIVDGEITKYKDNGKINCTTKIERKKSKHQYNPIGKLKFILKSMWKVRFRTLLSSMGLSFGIFGIMFTLFLLTGINKQIDKLGYSKVKENTLLVSSKTNDLINDSVLEKIANISGVNYVYKVNRFSVDIDNDSKKISSEAINIDPSSTRRTKYLKGRAPLDTYEIAISKRLFDRLNSKNMFKRNFTLRMQLLTSSVGNIYTVQDKQVKIVGVFKKAKGKKENIEISNKLADDYLKSSNLTKNKTTYLEIVRKEHNDINEIKGILKKQHLTTENNSIGTIKKYLYIITNIIIFLSSISLIVSTILICVVMYISVTERKKEIGIMKAIGTTPKVIQQLFLVEGSVVGGLGGLLGISGALLSSDLLNQVIRVFFKDINFDFFKIDLVCILIGMLVSVLLGTLGAYFPAKKASMQKPNEILKYE